MAHLKHSNYQPLDKTRRLLSECRNGKTFSIAFLYMRLVAEKGFSVDRILVTTFTDAATKELRERIRSRLLEAKNALSNPTEVPTDPLISQWLEHLANHDQCEPPLALRRLRLALVDFDEAPISTLHGFCKRMLAEHAFDSGSSFDQELIKNESTLVDTVLDDAWIGALHNAKADTPTDSEEVFTHAGREEFFKEASFKPCYGYVEQYVHDEIDSRKMNANAFAHRFKQALAVDSRRALNELKKKQASWATEATSHSGSRGHAAS